MFEFLVIQIQFLQTSPNGLTKIKIIDLKRLLNFVINNVFISNPLSMKN
jgi:hypothetical protein